MAAYPPYQRAERLVREFEPIDGVDYGWIFDYSLQQYDRVKDAIAATEARADQLVRYVGVAVALLAYGMSSLAAKANPLVTSALLVGVALAVLSIVYAIGVRVPRATAYPSGIEDVDDVIRNYDGKVEWAKGYLAAVTNVAFQDCAVTSQIKAAGIERAYFWLRCGLLWFVIAIPVTVLWGDSIVSWLGLSLP